MAGLVYKQATPDGVYGGGRRTPVKREFFSACSVFCGSNSSPRSAVPTFPPKPSLMLDKTQPCPVESGRVTTDPQTKSVQCFRLKYQIALN
jgi:hypothetical protein